MSTKKRKIDNEIIAFSLFNAIICFFSIWKYSKYEIINMNIVDICYSIFSHSHSKFNIKENKIMKS